MRIIDTNEIIEIWKMRDKKNETADIFKTVVEIYQSNFYLYRSCRSNKESFPIKLVVRLAMAPFCLRNIESKKSQVLASVWKTFFSSKSVLRLYQEIFHSRTPKTSVILIQRKLSVWRGRKKLFVDFKISLKFQKFLSTR